VRFLLFALTLSVLWELVAYMRFPRWSSSPLGVMSAGYQLLTHGEIYTDIRVSLLELLGGIVFGGSIALLVFALMSDNGIIRGALISLLPLSHISSLVLWLLSFLILGRIVPDFLNYWHKVLVVGCLVFFPFVQALWGLRDQPISYRILLAIDQALPIAFVAMLFGELFAATAGLGFMMVTASASYQTHKGLAGFLITVFLLVSLSTTLRWIVKRFYSLEKSSIVPLPVT
jgi:ABC-type nitrate/sulfonate/bicarbonate transport system permease component